MAIYLMRHGEYQVNSENVDVLSLKGTHDVEALAEFLNQSHIHISEIIHSKKNRAKQTASILASQLGSVQVREQEFITPNDDPTQLLSEIPALESDTLIVSHLPFLARIVSSLVLGHDRADLIDFQPSTFVCLTQTRLDLWAVSFVWSPQLSVSDR